MVEELAYSFLQDSWSDCAPGSNVIRQKLMASLVGPSVAGHDLGKVDYRGKQLTLIGGPLLDPFSASFQGELMLPGAQPLPAALYNKAHLAAIAASVSHGSAS